VGVVATLSGCWGFGLSTGQGVETDHPGTIGVGPSPMASPWPARSIVIVQLSGPDGGNVTADEADATAVSIQARLAALRVDASVRSIPDARLRIDVADPSNADSVKRVATAPGYLEFVPVPEAFANAIVEGEPLPADMTVGPLFGGDSVVSFELGEDAVGYPAIDLRFDDEASRVFDAWATGHLGERLAIVLDGHVVSAPVLLTDQFHGQAQISGAFDLGPTRELVAILQGGPLSVVAQVLDVCPAAGDCPGASPLPSLAPGH